MQRPFHNDLANFEGEMQVQQYLELFYQWIEPYVKSLGNPKEIKNLKAFVEGSKELEFDKFKYYLVVILE